MNPFVVVLISILAVAACLLLFSMAFTWIVLRASDRYTSKMVDKYAENIVNLMPGTNCGKCASVCPVGCLKIYDLSGVHRYVKPETD